jgi:MYXO-CTERM domain-containing protein
MQLRRFFLCGAASALLASPAVSELVDVMVLQRGDGSAVGAYAIFDSPADAVLGVLSGPDGGQIHFVANKFLVNTSAADVFVGQENDSWVAIGPDPGGTSVSPGWPGGSFGSNVESFEWTIPVGESYFQIGPGYAAGNNDDGVIGGVLIANFQFADEAEADDAWINYSGTLEYVLGGVGPRSRIFRAGPIEPPPPPPAPGALGVLAVAGLAGGGRRRR